MDPVTILAATGGAALLAYLLRRRKRSRQQQEQPPSGQSGQGGGKAQPPESQPQIQPPTESTQSQHYWVFDKNGKPVDEHFSFEDAKKSWIEDTDRKGTIVDVESLKDVTPKLSPIERIIEFLKRFFGKGTEKKKPDILLTSRDLKPQPMDREQLKKVEQACKGVGRGSFNEYLACDRVRLMEYVAAIDRKDLPVFNVARKRMDKAERLIPLKKRTRKIRKKTITVPDIKETKMLRTKVVPSNIPDNDMEIRRITGPSEILRTTRRVDLALPSDMLAKKIAQRELTTRQYLSEETEELTTSQASTKEVEVDEPYYEEWIDMVPAGFMPSGQLLTVLRDGSSSVSEESRHIIAAVPIAIIGRNLDNASRYYDRIFDGSPHELYKGETPQEKAKLIASIAARGTTRGGTDILRALEKAAEEIRSVANPEDQPEILLITDGNDFMTADQIGNILGEDILLHVICVNGRNESLYAHATTYVEIHGDDPENLEVR